MPKPGTGKLVFYFIAALAFVIPIAIFAQQPATVADQLSTPERLRKPGWWPTKGSAARNEFVGPGACAECHASLSEGQKLHSMALTSMPAAKSEILRKDKGESFRIGNYTYSLTHTADGSIAYSVSDGTQTMSGPVHWAFGTGKVGQSYLSEENGKFREMRFTYFRGLHTFDLTPNQTLSTATSLEKATGRIVPDDEIRRCFGCHTTASAGQDKFDPAHAMLGVSCEGCHGPGANHVAAQKGGIETGTGLIFNPRRLKPADQVDFCGSCHISWWDATLQGSFGVANVRFQPYRLENSKCWSKGDPRITCVACHNPHEPLVHDVSYYDQKCLSCHITKAAAKPTADHPGRACPVETKNCVTCHMPKTFLPEMHVDYSDHMIRIVRKGETFPN